MGLKALDAAIFGGRLYGFPGGQPWVFCRHANAQPPLEIWSHITNYAWQMSARERWDLAPKDQDRPDLWCSRGQDSWGVGTSYPKAAGQPTAESYLLIKSNNDTGQPA